MSVHQYLDASLQNGMLVHDYDDQNARRESLKSRKKYDMHVHNVCVYTLICGHQMYAVPFNWHVAR